MEIRREKDDAEGARTLRHFYYQYSILGVLGVDEF